MPAQVCPRTARRKRGPAAIYGAARARPVPLRRALRLHGAGGRRVAQSHKLLLRAWCIIMHAAEGVAQST